MVNIIVGTDSLPISPHGSSGDSVNQTIEPADELIEKVSSLIERINCGGRPKEADFRQALSNIHSVLSEDVFRQAEVVDLLVRLSFVNRGCDSFSYNMSAGVSSYYDNPGYKSLLIALGRSYGAVIDNDVLRNKVYDEVLKIPSRIIFSHQNQASALADGIAVCILLSKDILGELKAIEAKAEFIPDSMIFIWTEWKVIELLQKIFSKMESVNKVDVPYKKGLEERVWGKLSQLGDDNIRQLRDYIKDLHPKLLERRPYERFFEPYNALKEVSNHQQVERGEREPRQIAKKRKPKRLGDKQAKLPIDSPRSPQVCDRPLSLNSLELLPRAPNMNELPLLDATLDSHLADPNLPLGLLPPYDLNMLQGCGASLLPGDDFIYNPSASGVN
ncbi:MAG: hypothetical protein ACQEP8_03325 [Chlamydiota bacterium]